MDVTENIRAMKKNTRRSMPKVRSGCLTCKQRRIKCDEGKPSCHNCSRTGRRCEGYPMSRDGDGQTLQRQQHPNIEVYNLPFKVPGSQADRQLLHFYCTEAAGSLSSFSDPTLWTSLILQRSHHQPVVRNALVTLAALYREGLQNGQSIQVPESDNMQRIAKCHRQLRLYLRSPGASPETPLICSILFYAFESLAGDPVSAIQHLNNGLNLLKQSQAHWKNANDGLLPHLSAIFSRLDVQASAFDDTRSPVITLVTADEVAGMVHAIPDEIATLAHAEALLTKIQNWLMHHIVAHVAVKHSSIPLHLIQERLTLQHQYNRYLFAISRFLERLAPDSAQRALLLRIHAYMYHAILLENIPEYPASDLPLFNHATPNDIPNNSLQAALVDLQAFLSLEPPDNAPPKFTLSTQLIAILYYLCLKTTDCRSRELALSLLRHPRLPRKDGLWEADTAISILQKLMQHDPAEEVDVVTLEAVGSQFVDSEMGPLEVAIQRLSTRSVEPPDRDILEA